MPSALRVYCTALASARYSFWRLMAALMKPATPAPTRPSSHRARPSMGIMAPPLPWSLAPVRTRLLLRSRMWPTSPIKVMPLSSAARRILRRMSPLRMWLNSWAITPCSSWRLRWSMVPRVTATTASAGEMPAAKALMPRSSLSTYTGGTGILAARAISCTTFRQRRSAGSRVEGRMRVPPMLSATTLPPVDSCHHFTSATSATVAVTARPMLPKRCQEK